MGRLYFSLTSRLASSNRTQGIRLTSGRVMEHYLMAFQYGLPPHGGLGIGLERFTMKLVGDDNVRRTTLFPRDMSRLEP